MKIIVAGPGCARCQATERNVGEAVKALNLGAEVEHLYDVAAYAKLGVRLTPAVLLDGKVVTSGKVPTVEELRRLLA